MLWLKGGNFWMVPVLNKRTQLILFIVCQIGSRSLKGKNSHAVVERRMFWDSSCAEQKDSTDPFYSLSNWQSVIDGEKQPCCG